MLHASEQNRADVKERREQWLAELKDLKVEQLVFLDEFRSQNEHDPLERSSVKREPLGRASSVWPWCTTTMISSIRLDGSTAAMEVEGAIDGAVFRTYVEHILAPSLRLGDVVVMDNLRVHYDQEAIRLIEQGGARVKFLPPYSPDFNPIEKMWSKIKNLLRKKAARTKPDLSIVISEAFDEITSSDAEGWFFSCHIAASHS